MPTNKSLNNSDRKYLLDFFDHAPIGFHAFGPDRKIIDINKTELDMLGYRKEEIVGKKSWSDLIIPAEAVRFEQHWQKINTAGEIRNLNYTMVTKSGRQVHVLLNASARFDKAGKLINTRGSVVDITERYQMARTLWLTKQKLGRQKLAVEKNNAVLFGWLDRRDVEKRQLRDSIQKNLEQTVWPLLERLKRDGTALDRRNVLLLEKSLRDIADDFSVKLTDKKWRLSSREIEICKMLKNGLTTKDMADLLSTSVRTVEHHRNHIRKKMGIAKRGIDLGEYLRIYFFP